MNHDLPAQSAGLHFTPELVAKIEALMEAIRGCMTCRQPLGMRHTRACGMLAGQEVLSYDILHGKPKSEEIEPF